MIERLSDAAGFAVSRETLARIEEYVDLLRTAAQAQNLVSLPTLDDVWERHIIDSAQLLRHECAPGAWVDIGSGAGLPGLVLAIFSLGPFTLIEPRRLRVEFLKETVAKLDLTEKVTVLHAKSTAICATFEKITARAVAPLADFFAQTAHLSHSDTQWILPKGRNAQKELDEARRTWQGDFRLEPSLTDPTASILLATGVRRRAR